MNEGHPSHGELVKMASVRFLLAFLVLSAMFFLPAGTFAYWEAWVYLAILLVPMLFVLAYLFKNDPELLERRMKMREKVARQRLIIRLSYFPFLLAFLLPGFDKRFGWSDAPAGAVAAADVLVLLGYGMFFLALRENRFAARVIEVEPGQRVIASGPYAVVRHPMYSGILLFYSASPLALGSYWATIPALLMVPILMARILNEESVLSKELPGYGEYLKKTRYRLIPGIW